MYFIEISDDKITCKGEGQFKTNEQLEVSAEIYALLTRLPADFTQDDHGNIMTVTPAPEPEPEVQPPTTEERLAAAEAAILDLMEV